MEDRGTFVIGFVRFKERDGRYKDDWIRESGE